MEASTIIALIFGFATIIVAAISFHERQEKKTFSPEQKVALPRAPFCWFGWFAPCCPCDPVAKEWIERRITWLSNQFPSNIFTDRPLILPTNEFFPEKCDASKEYAQAVLHRVCQFMGVERSRVLLRFSHEPHKVWFVNDSGAYMPHTAGMYSHSQTGHVITLDDGQLYHPADLIATMAHELAHARLLGEGRLRWHHHDDELLTDLTAFILGFAIFMSNSPRAWTSTFTKWPGTRVNKPEYMTSPMYGYALAHLAWFQGQPNPAWVKYLGTNVINDCKDAIRFLFRDGDSSFRPSWLQRVSPASGRGVTRERREI